MRTTSRILMTVLWFWALAAPVLAHQDDLSNGQLVVASPVESKILRPPEEIFVEANTAYEQVDYATAIAGYRELLARGFSSGSVYFNLGNAYLRNGELGKAIAALRISRDLLPRDGDVRANLVFARQSTKDAIAPPVPSAVMSTLMFWHYRLSRSELAAVAAVMSLLFWGVGVARLYRTDSEMLRWLSIAFLIVLLAACGSLASHRFLDRPVAVIVPQEIDSHTAPNGDSVVRFKLHAGTEVRINDEREGWLRIVLPDGQQGWVESVWTEVVFDSGVSARL